MCLLLVKICLGLHNIRSLSSRLTADTCSFDSTTTDSLCYWSQDLNDGFDWSWYDANTAPPGFLGPETDHTTGTNNGNDRLAAQHIAQTYMYNYTNAITLKSQNT